MTDLARLEAVSDRNVPPTLFPGNNAVERLLAGYSAAKAAVFRHVPARYALSYDQAMLATQTVGDAIARNGDAILSQLDQGLDLYDAIAITMSSEDARQYMLAQYALACEGLGAFASGYADESVAKGLLSAADYSFIVDKKLEVFGHIVALEQRNGLRHLLNAEAVAAQTASQAGRLAPTKLTIRTGSNGIEGQMAGLGGGPLIPIVVAIAAVVLVSVCVKLYLDYQSNLKQAQLAHERCQEAQKYGYASTIESCDKLTANLETKGLTEQLFGKEGTSQLMRYVVAGAGIYLLLVFGPKIVDLVAATGERVKERRARLQT